MTKHIWPILLIVGAWYLFFKRPANAGPIKMVNFNDNEVDTISGGSIRVPGAKPGTVEY